MPTHNDLKEFRLAVTGGTSGLGLALVRSLVARGARVAFVARTARAGSSRSPMRQALTGSWVTSGARRTLIRSHYKF